MRVWAGERSERGGSVGGVVGRVLPDWFGVCLALPGCSPHITKLCNMAHSLPSIPVTPNPNPNPR